MFNSVIFKSSQYTCEKQSISIQIKCKINNFSLRNPMFKIFYEINRQKAMYICTYVPTAVTLRGQNFFRKEIR